jgi:hypothetical protein
MENYVPICPKCKSRNVKDRGMIGRDAYSNLHVCQTCGFQGPIFPEIPMEDAAKLPEQPINFNPSNMPIFADKILDKKLENKTLKIRIAIFLGGLITVIILLLLLSR